MAKQTSGVLVVVLGAVGLLTYTMCRTPATGPPIAPSAAPPTAATAEKPNPPKPAPMDEKTALLVKELTAKWDALQGVSAAFTTHLTNAAGKEGRTKGQGKYECLRKDGKFLVRFHLMNVVSFQKAESERLTTAEFLDYVHDGKDFYRQLHQPELWKTTKTTYSPDRVLQIGGEDLFRPLAERYVLTYVGEETVDGTVTKVIEATSVEGGGKQRHCFDPASGIRIKLVETDAKGETPLTLTLSEVQLNPEFSEGYFNYELPERFELIDETAKQP